MATKTITMIECDGCGFESDDVSKFYHFTMSELAGNKRKAPLRVFDFCLTCTATVTDKREPAEQGKLL